MSDQDTQQVSHFWVDDVRISKCNRNLETSISIKLLFLKQVNSSCVHRHRETVSRAAPHCGVISSATGHPQEQGEGQENIREKERERERERER